MGIAKSYPEAYAKTQLAIDYKLPDPSCGKVFISVCDRDKRHILSVARILRYLGFDICSTEGTARVLRGRQRDVRGRGKISGPHGGEASQHWRPHRRWQDRGNHQYAVRSGSRGDGYLLRTEAVRRGVTCVTAMSAANTYVSAIEAVREDQQGHGSANDMGMDVIALQDLPQPRCSVTSRGGRGRDFPPFARLKQSRSGGNSAPPAPHAVTWLHRVLPKGALRDDLGAEIEMSVSSVVRTNDRAHVNIQPTYVMAIPQGSGG